MLSVVVRDKGFGISRHNLGRLFEPYVVLEESRSSNPSGVGLGLYVCKIICERHKGDICCFSNGLGQGSVFEFRMLVHLASDNVIREIRGV